MKPFELTQNSSTGSGMRIFALTFGLTNSFTRCMLNMATEARMSDATLVEEIFLKKSMYV